MSFKVEIEENDVRDVKMVKQEPVEEFSSFEITLKENNVKDVNMLKQEPATEVSSCVIISEENVKDINRVKQEPTMQISSCKITSKRRMREDEIKAVKLVKQEPMPDLLSYIKQERRNMLVDSDSAEDIEAFLYQSIEKLKTNSSYSLSFERLTGFLGLGTYSTRNASIFRTPENPFMLSFYSPLQPSYGINRNVPAGSSRVTNRSTQRSASEQEYHHPILGNFSMEFDPIDNGDPSSLWVYRRTGEQLYRDSLQREAKTDECFINGEYVCDPMWGSHFQNPLATVSENSLLTQLVIILRDWNIPMYQKCMNDYKIVRKRKPEFWDKISLKVFPYVMLEHCPDARIVADFFHRMCMYAKPITHLVKMKSCYLRFFLMNMAAVNSIQFSQTIDSEMWSFAKRELIERAFVSGEIANLQLLLQYFRPDYLWSNDDMEFLRAPQTNWETRVLNIENVASGYYGKLILLNLVRLGTFVSESKAQKSVKTECIRLLWRASVEPYVTQEDIKDAFKPLNASLLVRHVLIHACKSLLLEAYPAECFAEYKPRSLMHLSRCAVRRSLISAAYIPYLPLPAKLQKYVNLDW